MRSVGETPSDLVEASRQASDPRQLLLLSDVSGPLEAQPPRVRRIYCNRNLRLDHIQLVGFDMDYTLAVYKQAELDRLSIEATIATSKRPITARASSRVRSADRRTNNVRSGPIRVAFIRSIRCSR